MPSIINIVNKPFDYHKADIVLEGANNLLASKGISAKPKRAMLTEGINSCTGVAILSSKMNKLFHLAPELNSIDAVAQHLEKAIQQIKSLLGINGDTDLIKCFITGGYETKLGDLESEKSCKIYNTCAEILFDKFHINGAMLCGKEKGSSKEDLEVIGNNINLCITDFKPETLAAHDIEKALDNRYQTVETHGSVNFNYII